MICFGKGEFDVFLKLAVITGEQLHESTRIAARHQRMFEQCEEFPGFWY